MPADRAYWGWVGISAGNFVTSACEYGKGYLIFLQLGTKKIIGVLL